MKKTVFILTLAFVAFISNVNAADTTTFILNSNNVNTEVSNDLRINPFCMAIAKGDTSTVKRLIEFGENVNQKSNGMTPAMYAARYNRAEILELLIENGANLNIKSKQGFKALKYAKVAGAKAAVKVIENALDS